MGRLSATKLKQNPHATELIQLQEELGRVSEKFESCQGEFGEALDRHVHDLKREVETELSRLNSAGDLRCLPPAFASARKVTRV